MLGLGGSLSPPSLLLPRDPVTPRRLCVRGAFTAATRESIQICVCGRCVCCWYFQCLTVSQWRLAFGSNFLPSVCVREAEREEKTSPSKEVRQQTPPPIHSEWHHPRRSHSQQQQLTHTDTRNEKGEQCTGNTQRRSPPAAGAAAGASLFTRQHTPSNPNTQSNRRDAREHDRPLQSPRAVTSHFTVLPSGAPAPQPPQTHITQHRKRILRLTDPQREIHVGTCSC
ncbi:hypothetical protein TCDM_09099 [Trypanosoma cruzi Dm28c]|uniref:Uncharacterized protein n=1 Tax=Trypanosoma cruzi Dm28c TaxID=1416333 RepID=V5AQV6_TRYCR|nr:hypothetical protein TCDM_09099 [Trypanosoma cruzi Dm28c]